MGKLRKLAQQCNRAHQEFKAAPSYQKAVRLQVAQQKHTEERLRAIKLVSL